jgi:hypothetical protein
MKSLLIAALAALVPFVIAQSPAPLTEAQKQEVSALKAKAAKLTKQVGSIATNSNLQDSDEGIKLLRQAVDELTAIRERLKALEDARATDKKQSETVSKDIQALKNTRFTGYIQFQYNDTNKIGSTTFDAYQVRRARLGIIQKIDPRASLRLSAEFADGNSRMDTRLKDAVMDYDLTPNFGSPGRISLGQQNLPLGFDLERGDADREFPERATYSRTLFAAERGRGVIVRANLDKRTEIGIGSTNALSVEDPEQAGQAPGTGSKIGGLAYLRNTGPNYRVGISGFAATRPAYTAAAMTSPEVNRWFTYIDGELRFSKAYVRGEVMIGHDRTPNAVADPTRVAHDMSGFQAIAGYNFDTKNQLNFRWEQFDPNKDAAGNAVNAYALSYQHFLSPMAKLQLAHEIFIDESRASLGQRRFFQTTLRVQFRF